MMKPFFLSSLLFLPLFLFAQFEASMLFHWDDPSIPGTNAYDNAYNDVWGVVVDGREFAVIGSTQGVHFIDVTDPANATVLDHAFVPGADAGAHLIHRDIKSYGCYLYAVADEGSSSLQIIDYSFLPDSVSVVYDSSEEIVQAHNVFIDEENARMYAVTLNDPNGFFPLRVFSLENPEQPVPLGDWGQGIVGHVHDAYVRDNIGYLNCGGDGFYIVDFKDMSNPTILGSLTTYPQQGYNHSGWLSNDGAYYYMADETNNKDIKVLDVSEFFNIRVVETINSGNTVRHIPHNQLVRGNYMYSSYYHDGIQVFDITDPAQPVRYAYYDTYPTEVTTGYFGAWGVYPFLPSGNILVSDMQSGLYVLGKVDMSITPSSSSDFSALSQCGMLSSLHSPPSANFSVAVFPQPIEEQFTVEFNTKNTEDVQLSLFDLTGRIVEKWSEKRIPQGEFTLNLSIKEDLAQGVYFLRILGESGELTHKIIK